MVINSVIFFIFFTIVLLVYYTLMAKWKHGQNVWLLITSLFFYAWADPRMVALLVFAILVYYGIGRGIEHYLSSRKQRAKRLMQAGILIGVLLLFCFKYAGFFVEQVTTLLQSVGLQINTHVVNVMVPLGISYFTFKLMSYVVDVYRGTMRSCSDGIAFAAYVSFFPTIMSGPIDRAVQFLPQLEHPRRFSANHFSAGAQRVVWGLFLKTCVADRINPYTDAVFNNMTQHNGSTIALASILFLLQMYSDFCGYSHMAIGVGRMMGLEVCENFSRPFFALNGADFWRRWHISLSNWLRDYIYIPMGGSRCKPWRSFLNVMVTFVACGLWHGANWTYVIFGAYHGILVILSRVMKTPRELLEERFNGLRTNICFRTVRQLVTFALCALGAFYFRANSLTDIKIGLSKLFGEYGPIYTEGTTSIFSLGLISILIMIVSEWREEYERKGSLLKSSRLATRTVATALLLVWIMLAGELESVSFIYFQF